MAGIQVPDRGLSGCLLQPPRCACLGAFGQGPRPNSGALRYGTQVLPSPTRCSWHDAHSSLCRQQSRRDGLRCSAHKGADEEEVTLFGLTLSSGSRAQQLRDALATHKQRAASAGAGLLLAGFLASGGPAFASDVAKVGTCLLGNCQLALARCVSDGQCLENLVCLQLCNGRKDESACQIRCGDLYQDKAVEAFTACAVSDKKCVPQKVDRDAFPVPSDCALDQGFDLSTFQGRWYITAGLNPLFDQFDCQEHFFGVPEPGKLFGKINWRISKGDNDFIERNTVQTFKQVSGQPAKLENHGNAFLHYSDDWYVLGYKPDQYALIYYIGNNDAWEGYGGATVYTRSPTLPEEYIPEIKERLKPLGIKWEDFKLTNNSCGPHPPAVNPLERIEKFAEGEVTAVEYELEKDLRSFGKGFTVIEQELGRELTQEEKEVQNELRDAEQFLEGIEGQYKLPSFLEAPLKLFRGFRLPFFGGGPAAAQPTAAPASSQRS